MLVSDGGVDDVVGVWVMMWIDFYLNVGDLFVYVCWLLCKVY